MALYTVCDDTINIPAGGANTNAFSIGTLAKLKVRFNEISSTGTTLTDTPAFVQIYRATGTAAGTTVPLAAVDEDWTGATPAFSCKSARTTAITGLTLTTRLWAFNLYFPSDRPVLDLPDTGFVISPAGGAGGAGNFVVVIANAQTHNYTIGFEIEQLS